MAKMLTLRNGKGKLCWYRAEHYPMLSMGSRRCYHENGNSEIECSGISISPDCPLPDAPEPQIFDRKLISDVAQEAHTMGRIYSTGGEVLGPADEFRRVEDMVDRMTAALESTQESQGFEEWRKENIKLIVFCHVGMADPQDVFSAFEKCWNAAQATQAGTTDEGALTMKRNALI